MKKTLLIAGLLFLFTAASVWAGEENEEANNGEDITRPLTRIDLRYQYKNLSPRKNDSDNIATLRAEKKFELSKTWRLATRLDVPLDYTDKISADENSRGNFKFGLGDILAQALIVHDITERVSWSAGSQLIMPTARQEEMGDGKWQVVPTLAARCHLPEISQGSWGSMLARYDVDFAGDHDRKHIKQLEFAPTLNINLPRMWFVELFPSSDIRINLEDKGKKDTGRLFLPLNFMLGKMLTKHMVASAEFGIPIIDDYKVYDFKCEFRIGFFF